MDAQATPKPAERRRKQQRVAVRREILDATEELLVANGYEAFSMRRLADRCGYTAPTIYHHFGDKRGLIDALLEERFSFLVERIRSVPTAGDPLETLRRQLRAFVRFGVEYPTHYRLLSVPRLDPDSPPPQSAEQSRAIIEVTLSQLAGEQRLLIDGIEQAVQCIWVMVHGLTALQISRPDYDWTPNHVEVSLDTLLRGLVAPAPGSGDGVQGAK